MAKFRSTTNTQKMKQRVDAAGVARFQRQVTTVFEHGQWWVIVLDDACDERTYSVVDAVGGKSVDGFDFEEV